MANDLVRYELTGAVARLTLNDPKTLNALSTAMVDGLLAALARADGEARAVLLTGEGRGFCSGANLTQHDGGPIGGTLVSHYNPLMTALRDLPIPFVTAVNGAAAGIGCPLALMGDLIIAGESAYFLQAFSRIGLVPDGGSTWLLPRLIGRARAMEMMLLGERISASQALDWGLINRCVPDAELNDEATALANRLAQGPKSLALLRKLAWAGLEQNWATQIALEYQTQTAAGRTADFLEGVGAFLQKREAKFTGS